MTGEGHPVPFLDRPDDETLTFMTSSNRRKMRNIKQSRWVWVQYALEDFDSSKRWVRRSIAGNPFAPQIFLGQNSSPDFAQECQEYPVLVLGRGGQEWAEDFQKAAKKFYAVKVELVWYDDSKVEHSNTRTFRTLWPHPNFFSICFRGWNKCGLPLRTIGELLF